MAVTAFKPVRVGLGGSRLSKGSDARTAFAKIEENFRMWTLHLGGQSGEVLKEALSPTLDKAKRYCPKKSGKLRSSGYLEVVKGGNGAYQAEIGFGRGGTPDYTIYVHEVPYIHAPPTRWKFLQLALSEDEARIRRALATGFRRASGV